MKIWQTVAIVVSVLVLIGLLVFGVLLGDILGFIISFTIELLVMTIGVLLGRAFALQKLKILTEQFDYDLRLFEITDSSLPYKFFNSYPRKVEVPSRIALLW
jgi:hypothetical protein